MVVGLAHEVAGNGRAGTDSDIADGLLAGLDRVEPVFVMVLGVVELHLGVCEVFAFGEDDLTVEGCALVGLFVPELVNGLAAEDELELAAVDVYFAIRAEE